LHRPELEVLDAAGLADETTTEVALVIVGAATTVKLVSTEVVAVAVELNDVVALELLFPSPQNVMRRLTFSTWHAT
jgi:hypothetical protein